MEQNYLPWAAKLLAAQRKRKRWQQVVSCLGAAVVFCTVYALILPAITMSRPLVCELEEHQHDESCYAVVEPAAEASPLASVTAVESAPEIRQLCSLESVYAGLEAEEHAPFVLHTHDASCYRDGELICTFPEILPHVHEDACYVQERILICGQEEEIEILDDLVPAGHVHTDECYGDELACGKEEVPASEGHHHGENCYTVETVQGGLICANTEEGHQHDESCYAPEEEIPVLTCGLEESEPVEGHTHTPDCFQRQLVCGIEEDEEPGAEDGEEAAPGHVHTEACYAPGEYVAGCGDRRIAHEHTAECRDASGALICGSLVTREHVHTPECFQETAPSQPEPDLDSDPDSQPEPEKTLICGKAEHTHEEACYGPEETGDPEEAENPEEPGEQDGQWDAIFWGGVVSEASGVVLDAWTSGSWMDTAAMDPEELTRLREAGEVDLTRALQSAAIQVGSRAYDSALHGPMDPSGEFSIVLNWTLDSASFSSMTYSYEFPWQINVENVEKRVLNDAGGQQALTYSVWNNVLTVTYYTPADSVSTGFSLRASWAEELGMDTELQWSRSESTYVVFAEPELTVEKTMGEGGLRVAEDGSVWADYTVTVTNTGMVAAAGITLTDVLEAQRFTFAQGGYENGADYMVTAGGRDSYENFDGYDGGSAVTFPVFDLEPEESRVFQYKAVMSAEDREAVDAAIKADPTQAAETVRNTATAVCPAPGGDLEFTSSARATYGGPESRHVENFTYNYQSESGAFDVVFTVNGDAQLPPGMTAEKLEQTTGEGLQLTVEALDETAGEYQAFARYVEEDENLLDLQVLRLGLNYNGVKLDLTDCDVEAAVTPSDALRNYQPPHVVNYNLTEEEKEAAAAEKPLGDEGFGIEVKAFALSEEAEATVPEFVEAGSVYLDMGDNPEREEAAGAAAPISFAVRKNLMAVRAGTETYPEYTVEFYANVKHLSFADSGAADDGLTVINTSGANGEATGTARMPNNQSSPDVLYLQRASDGTIVTERRSTKMFNPVNLKFNPQRDLTLGMFNILDQLNQDNENNYELIKATITQPGATEGETEVIEIDLKELKKSPSEIHLTNMQSTDGDTIWIKNGATIKLEFDPTSGQHTNAVAFYDYDITDGYIYKDKNWNGKTEVSNQGTGSWYANTAQQGINDPANYSGSGTKFVFGNAEGTTPKNGLGDKTWTDGGGVSNTPNRANAGKFKNCTFGIVTGLQNGNLIYASGLDVPNLFNESGKAMKGKTPYTDYSLQFNREGDTYTLTAVNGAGAYGQNLDKLYRTRSNWNNTLQLYSNDFWPMDGTATHGTDGHDFKFGDGKGKMYDGVSPEEKTAPEADYDGVLHNAYFGMQFDLEFTIPEGYTGPLDYCFFGDDDLWLFLNNQLVCDIGGVHSSVGEYVNLRDYIPEGTSGTYQLHLYFTERGASGSTCWMQFTLPGLRSVPIDVPPGEESGRLRIEKKVEGAVSAGTEFSFSLDLRGTSNQYNCKYLDANGVEKKDEDGNVIIETIKAGQNETFLFTLKANESLVVDDLTPGMSYTIRELSDGINSYETTMIRSENGSVEEVVDKTNSKQVSGSVSGSTSILVTYTNKFFYALPETGGAGTAGMVWYTLGALPVMAAAVLVYKRSRKKGGTQF